MNRRNKMTVYYFVQSEIFSFTNFSFYDYTLCIYLVLHRLRLTRISELYVYIFIFFLFFKQSDFTDLTRGIRPKFKPTRILLLKLNRLQKEKLQYSIKFQH